jgi:hypothetical protein
MSEEEEKIPTEHTHRVQGVGSSAARDALQELRSQGERASGAVWQQVERHPITSLAIAFALGYLAAILIRR